MSYKRNTNLINMQFIYAEINKQLSEIIFQMVIFSDCFFILFIPKKTLSITR